DTGAPVDAAAVPGELHARGPTVAQGYWGDPERGARGFADGPEAGDRRLYRTGDIVTRDGDGHYRLIGPGDRMIKSRGYRIELDEIGTLLIAHPSVKEAAVVVVPDDLIGNRILGFVAVGHGANEHGGTLRDYCLQKLPRYMVPESFTLCDQLPKTSTGKIDRVALVETARR